jgi:hypothetical protein
MEKRSESLRESLLARLPQPENLAAYREEVEASLRKNQRAFRREKWGVGVLWVFMVGLSTVFLVLGGQHLDKPLGLWFGTLACFWLIYPSVELLKHFINRSRVEVLKEVKQLQLQVLEIQASLQDKDARRA